MPTAVVHFTFGSFGDIIALIQLAIALKDCLADGATMRKDLEDFVHFLELYISALQCIKSVLESRSAQQLQPSSRNAIKYALAVSVNLVQDFQSQIDGFKLPQWWASVLLRTFRWAFCTKKALSELQEKLLAQSNMITLLLSLSGLGITLDLAANTSYLQLPPQPRTHSVALVDFLDQRTDVPVDICLDQSANV
ncbi:unnamed protein product [Somion occarium]|uniref:Uncharacterized protein n=1 Tax=Somion occarium TaxID=3059160 RepID=A0ABP1CWU3_9APHY